MNQNQKNMLDVVATALKLVEEHLRQWPDHEDIAAVRTQLLELQVETKNMWPPARPVLIPRFLSNYALRELEDRLPELARALMDLTGPIDEELGEDWFVEDDQAGD